MKKFMLLILCIGLLFAVKTQAEEKWKGLDEAVIEKVAEEKGRAPKNLFELEGDTELFMFSLFSGISGFIAGYYWRKLITEGKNAPSKDISSNLSHKG